MDWFVREINNISNECVECMLLFGIYTIEKNEKITVIRLIGIERLYKGLWLWIEFVILYIKLQIKQVGVNNIFITSNR
jgi:hypothetical protein